MKPLTNWREYALWPEWAQLTLGAVLIILALPLLAFAYIVYRATGREIEGGFWLLIYIGAITLALTLWLA